MPKPLTRPPRKSRTTQEYEIKGMVRLFRDQFREDKDPIELMYAFTMAVREGWYPPSSIIRAVSARFERVLLADQTDNSFFGVDARPDKCVVDDQGCPSLDLAFSLKRKGTDKKNWTAFTVKKRRGVQFWLVYKMSNLIEGNDFTVAQAAAEVSLLSKSLPTAPYTAVTLEQQYSTWKKRFSRELATARELNLDARRQ
jgi:hypothetical protein